MAVLPVRLRDTMCAYAMLLLCSSGYFPPFVIEDTRGLNRDLCVLLRRAVYRNLPPLCVAWRELRLCVEKISRPRANSSRENLLFIFTQSVVTAFPRDPQY
jgi:hypothetical protein